MQTNMEGGPRQLVAFELQRLLPNVGVPMLKCPQCDAFPNEVTPYSQDDSIYTLSCLLCHNHWHVCNRCFGSNSRHSDTQVITHIRNHHKKEKKKPRTDCYPSAPSVTDFTAAVGDDGGDTDVTSTAIEVDPPTLPLLHATRPGNIQNISLEARHHLQNNPRLQYFLHNSNGKGKCFFLGTNMCEDSTGTNVCSQHDADMHMKFGELVHSMTSGQRQLLCSVIDNTLPHMLKNHVDGDGPSNPFRYPKDITGLDRVHLRGKHSLHNVLPHPPVTVKDDHSYSSLIDSVESFLAFGTGVDELLLLRSDEEGNILSHDVPDHFSDHDPVTSPRESRRAFDIKKKALLAAKQSVKKLCEETGRFVSSRTFLVSIYTLWMDDFNPLVSIVKMNVAGQGVWVLQATFSNDDTKSHEFSNTCVLALGPKGADHEPVLSLVEDDIKTLGSGRCRQMHYGRTGEMVTPIFLDVVRHGDQPERRDDNGLKLGMNTNHAWWRRSVNFKDVGAYLVSCADCKSIVEQANTNRDLTLFESVRNGCGCCTNWSCEPTNKLLHSSPPADFPVSKLPPSRRLPPLRLNYSSLTEVATETHDFLVDGTWSQKEAEAWLSYHCISGKLQNGIVENAMNCKLFNTVEEEHRNEPDDECLLAVHRILLSDRRGNAERHERCPHPAVWKGSAGLRLWHDTPMHLVAGFVMLSLPFLFLLVGFLLLCLMLFLFFSFFILLLLSSVCFCLLCILLVLLSLCCC